MNKTRYSPLGSLLTGLTGKLVLALPLCGCTVGAAVTPQEISDVVTADAPALMEKKIEIVDLLDGSASLYLDNALLARWTPA